MEEENKEMSEQAEASGIGHFPDHEDLIVTSVEMLKSQAPIPNRVWSVPHDRS